MFLTLDLSSHDGGNEQIKQMPTRYGGGDPSIYEVVKQVIRFPHPVVGTGIGQIFPFLKGAIEERRRSRTAMERFPKVAQAMLPAFF